MQKNSARFSKMPVDKCLNAPELHSTREVLTVWPLTGHSITWLYFCDSDGCLYKYSRCPTAESGKVI